MATDAASQPYLPAETGQVEASSFDRWQWLARIALVTLIGAMCISAYRHHPSRTPLDVSLWQNINAGRATQLAYRLLLQWGTPIVAMMVAGFLVPVALGPAGRMRWGRLPPVATIALAGLVICGLVRAVELARLPALAHFLLPLAAFGVGAWIATAIPRGLRAVGWRVGILAVIALVLVVGAAGTAWLSVQRAPFPFDMSPVTSADMRLLANRVRGHRASLDEGRHILLTSQDLDLMVAGGLSRVSPKSKGRAAIVRNLIDAEVSLAVPRRDPPLFVNVQVSGAAQIDDGELSLRIDRLRIGSLRVPWLLLRLITPAIATAVRHDTELRNLASSIDRMRLENDQIHIDFKPGECSNTFVPALAHLVSGQPKVTAQVRDHVRNLIAGAAQMPVGDERFAAALRQAFAFARQRSASGDPLLENRAAMLALAILMGHERVETAIGQVIDPADRERARREFQTVTLRGRPDWTKHFYVSAAMALLACEGTSNKIGTLKEALDAEDGGSGFSFADFAANRAGIRLALDAATSDPETARRLQDLLSGNFAIEDVFPDVSDLPENLTTAELNARFGGVGGAEYQRLLAEIERRLSRCAALR